MGAKRKNSLTKSGENIRNLRYLLEISQKTMAEELGISYNYLSKYEIGSRVVRLSLALKLLEISKRSLKKFVLSDFYEGAID